MANLKPFRFQQFSINHHHCAHKVGTDGVLLGAWIQANNPKSILDVGSGSGLIALMLAQRFSSASITGIEIDEDSFLQGKDNFDNSPFANRLKMFHGDFLELKNTIGFDLIVSNPPYFQGNTTSGNLRRDRARHEEHLPQHRFLTKCKQLLTPAGTLGVILPAGESEYFIALARNENLFLNRCCKVYGRKDSPLKRVLLEFSGVEDTIKEEELILRNPTNEYTSQYKKLTAEFHI